MHGPLFLLYVIFFFLACKQIILFCITFVSLILSASELKVGTAWVVLGSMDLWKEWNKRWVSFKTTLTSGFRRDRRADRILEISPGLLPSLRNWLFVSLQVPGTVCLNKMLMAQLVVLTHGSGRGTLIMVYIEPSCFLNKGIMPKFLLFGNTLMTWALATPIQGPLK